MQTDRWREGQQRCRWREGQFFEGQCKQTDGGRGNKDADGGRGNSLRGSANRQMEGGATKMEGGAIL